MIFLALILLALATQAQVEHICSLRFGASRCEISNYIKRKLSAFPNLLKQMSSDMLYVVSAPSVLFTMPAGHTGFLLLKIFNLIYNLFIFL